MEKPTKRAPVVTEAATLGALTALYGVPEEAPCEPMRLSVSSSFGLPVLSSGQFQVLLEELKRVERLEEALFLGRQRKP